MSDESRAGDLRPAPYNPRTITAREMELLERAMSRFGDLGGIVYNRTTGHVIGGHQRLKVIPPDAEIERVREVSTILGTVAVGWINVDGELWAYREVEWAEEVEAMANIAANKHGGSFDMPAVRDILADLDTGEFDLELSGFDEEELERLMAPIGPDPEEEASGRQAEDQAITVTCPDCSATFEVARKSKYEVSS